MRTFGRTLARTGVLQVDSVNVLARAHLMPLYSRMGPYDVQLLERAASGRETRRLVEYWAHVQAFMPVDLWPAMRLRMDSYRGQRGKWGFTADADLEPAVLAAVRERGPVTARDLDAEFSGPRTKEHWGWNWSDARQVLDYLFLVGDVAIAGRSSQFEVLYDVPERVLPRAVLEAPTPDRGGGGPRAGPPRRPLPRRRAPPPAWPTTTGCAPSPARTVSPTPRRRSATWSRPASSSRSRSRAGAARPTSTRRPPAARGPAPARCSAPFDPVVWERDPHRVALRLPLPDRDLRPRPAAPYGYYVLPFLLGDRIVGRVDLKADRAGGRLLVLAAYGEDGAPPETAAELAIELRRLAGWLGLADVVGGPARRPGRPAGRRAHLTDLSVPLFRSLLRPLGSMAGGPRRTARPRDVNSRSQSPVPAIIDKILRIGEGKIIRQLESIAQAVSAIEDDFVAMSDDELRGMTEEFRKRLADGETLDDLMPEAFATVREAAKRVIGQRHYDVQIMGGAALHLGNIAEMKTGEGKTLVATLPSYLNALEGKGVHIVTVNDYLAKYHAEWMGRIHHFLGLTTGVILPSMRPDERREAYACDITYGTNNELGFDYLRDNMASALEDCVQRTHNFAIVDEVDSILVDEARTPLIISGPTQDEVRWYGEFSKIAAKLTRDVDYEVDEKKRTISVLEPGITKVEDHLGHREPLRVGEHAAHLVHAQLDQGQGAVPQRQGVRRHERRGAHRRRAHRPHPVGPPLQRRPPPGDRGEGGRRGPRGVPDARHDHAAELLPPLRQALRHDRNGHDRGQRVRQDLQPRRGADPDQHADGA